ncbi:MAG: NAD-glutamate dehydrogenase, partial [Hyphomicrobiales bacterium]|nr:NAD-glutamate dehydrogenase [Hyphomicrobiales bacterium]
MAVQNIPRPADGGASEPLLDGAAAPSPHRGREMPPDFIAELYAHAAADDLDRYTPAEIAAIGEDAWSFLLERTPGAPKIAFLPARLTPGVTVLDILNDDMPFLVDSVIGELTDRGLDVRLLAHPVFTVDRDAGGGLVQFRGVRRGDGQRESFIHLHVANIEDAGAQADAVRAIEGVLTDVRVSVQDWRAMLARVSEVTAELRANPPPLPADETAEAVQFLQWIAADNFTLLGARDYAYTDNEHALEPISETGLGLLRSRDMHLLRRGNQLVTITPEILEFLKEPKLLIVTKTAVRSRVHRRVHLDYIGVKRFDADGNLVGERRFCGLFTSTAYTRSVRAIPYLRRKVDHIFSRAGFDPSSHSGKALVNVLEHYPRDELFQIDEDTLYQFALAILQLDQRPRVRVLPRRDRFDRFVSILVYIPRERYDSRIRARIGDYLAIAYKGRTRAFYPFFPEGPLVRVHFIIGRYEGETPNIDRAVLDRAVENIVRNWVDRLGEALAEHAPEQAHTLSLRYRNAFPVDYREVYAPPMAVADIAVVEALTAERPLGVELYRDTGGEATNAGLKVLSHRRPIPLSERVPVLENMGFRVVDERTYHIEPEDAADVWFHDMTLESALGEAFDLPALKDKLEEGFLAVMSGYAENDGYNALTLATGLGWRDIALIRTLSRFLRQVRVPYSQDYMWTTLRKHAAIAAEIVALFHARFDPALGPADGERAAVQETIAAKIETALQAVDSLDEDRIVRRFVNAVQSAIRSNFYQHGADGRPKPLISVKFASRKLDGMPLPRPLYEIFVYSPRVEGVHLRFGKVARGGIRWSDRPQDFRTEILGLVKAQQVKNAVIVPVGAKGGFVPKLMPKNPTREQFQAEGVATYKLFISTLLDITDNFAADGTLVKPDNVVRHEGDDPYLV